MKQKIVLLLLLPMLFSCKSEIEYPQILTLSNIVEEEFKVYTSNNVQTEFDSTLISISELFDSVTVFQDSIVFSDEQIAGLFGGFFGYRTISYEIDQDLFTFNIGVLHTNDLTPQIFNIMYQTWEGLNHELLAKLDRSNSDELIVFGDFNTLEIPCLAYQYVDNVSDNKATIGKMVLGELSEEHLSLIEDNDTLIVKKYTLVYENHQP